MTQKGFIIGASNGHLLVYEFTNDFEPKLINKLHLSNRVKAFASMSISKGSTANDDYMIAVAGVYQKLVKKFLRKHNEINDEQQRQRARTFSPRRLRKYSGTLNEQTEEFFMP